MTEPILPWFKPRSDRYAQVPQPRCLTEAISFIRNNLNQRTAMNRILAFVWSDKDLCYVACYDDGTVVRAKNHCSD
jgi:hypothetical protein